MDTAQAKLRRATASSRTAHSRSVFFRGRGTLAESSGSGFFGPSPGVSQTQPIQDSQPVPEVQRQEDERRPLLEPDGGGPVEARQADAAIEPPDEREEEIGPVGIQAKLTIGDPDDPLEKEADAVAEQVVREEEVGPSQFGRAGKAVLRKPAPGSASPAPTPSFETSVQGARGQGAPLSQPVRADLENRLGRDLGGVKVHTGSHAQSLSRDISARAFTHGNDIYFASGQFAPESRDGKHLLAHEVVHTLQQSEGRADPRRLSRELPGDSESDPSVTETASAALGIDHAAAAPGDAGGEDVLGLSNDATAVRSPTAGDDAAVQTASVSASSAGATAAATVTAPSPPTVAAPAPAPDIGEQAARADADHRRELAQAARIEQEAGGRDADQQRADGERASAAIQQGAAQEPAQDNDVGDNDELSLPRLADLVAPLPEPVTSASAVGPQIAQIVPFPGEGSPAPELGPEAAAPAQPMPGGGTDFIASATERLNSESAEVQARVQVDADDAQQRVRSSARTMRARVRGQVRRTVAGLRERFGGQRSRITSAISAASGQVYSQLSARLAEAEVLRRQTRTDTSGIFRDHRTTMQRVVRENVEAAEALNERFSDQARRTTREKRATVRRRGSDQVARYPNTRRGVVQQNAARGVANRVEAEMRDRLPETLAAIDEVTAPIPQEFRDKGRQALEGFDNGLPELLQGIDDQVAELTRTLQEQAQRADQQLDAMQRQWLAQVDRSESAAIARAQGFEPQAMAQIDRGRRVALRQIERAAERANAPIGGVVAEAVAMLQATEDADPDATAAFAEIVLRWVNGIADEASDAIGQAADGVERELGRAGPLTAQGLGQVSRQVDRQLATDETTLSLGLADFVMRVDTAYGVTIQRTRDSFIATQAEIRRRLTPAVTDLERDFSRTLRDAEARIRDAVNEGLGKHNEALRLLGGDMREAASDAAWDYDHPVLSTLRDIGAIVLGVIVGILAIIAIIVVVIVAIKAAAFLLVLAGLTAATAALVAKIVVIGGLLAYAAYQGYQAYNAYRATGQSSGEAFLNVLQDFTGINDIRRAFGDENLSYYERGKAFGRGATILVLSLLGGRALIARFRGRVPPSVPNPRLPPGASRVARGQLAARLAVPTPRLRLPSFRRPPAAPQGRPPIGFGNRPLPRSHPSRVAVEGPPPPSRPIGFGTRPLPRSHPSRVAVEGPPPAPRRPIGFGNRPQPRSPSTPPPLPRQPIGFGTRPLPRAHPRRVALEGPPPPPRRPIGFGAEPVPRTHPSRVAVEGPPTEPRIGFLRNPRAARTSPPASGSGPRATSAPTSATPEPFFAPRRPTAGGRGTPPGGRAPVRPVASAGNNPPTAAPPRQVAQPTGAQTPGAGRPPARATSPSEPLPPSRQLPAGSREVRAWVQLDNGAIVEITTTGDVALGMRINVGGARGRVITINAGPQVPGERLPELRDLRTRRARPAPDPAAAGRTQARAIINRHRAEARTAAHESGRHTWPRQAANELERAAAAARAENQPQPYIEALENAAKTMRSREAGHRGGISGRGRR